jgi:superoxide dismutase, Fe-Mn family
MNEETKPSRRDFMATAAMGAGSLALSPAAAAATDAPKETVMSTAPAFQTSDKLKPLAFDPAKLNGCPSD